MRSLVTIAYMRREVVDGSQRKARRQRAPLLLVASGATSNANTLKPFSSVTQLQEKQQRSHGCTMPPCWSTDCSDACEHLFMLVCHWGPRIYLKVCLALDNSPGGWQAAFWRHTAAATAQLFSHGKMLGTRQIIDLALGCHCPDGRSASEGVRHGGQCVHLGFWV